MRSGGAVVRQGIHARRSGRHARLYVDAPGYVTSIRKRMRIEEVFGYLKTIVGLAKVC